MTSFQKEDFGSHRAIRAWIPLLILLAVASRCVAEDFRMEASKDAAGNFNLAFPSDANSYYILYQGETFNQIASPRAILSGKTGWDRFVVPLPSSGAARAAFFRIAKIPMNLPLDTDGDGMPDAWELEHQLDPLDPSDAARDEDGDGLSNVEESRAGTDPRSADSDGDGLSDGFEVKESLTNPQVKDFPEFVTAAEIEGASAINQLGRWSVEGDTIYAEDRRGFVEYTLTVTTADIFWLEVEGRERFFRAPAAPLNLLLSVDGEFLGRVALTSDSASNGRAWAITPWLNPGAHIVRIYWDNAADDRSLLIKAVRLQVRSGPDADGNGIKDWVESRLRTLCGVEVGGTPAPDVIYSASSPYCLEGRERHVGTLSLNSGPDGSAAGETHALAAIHAAGNRWYADVPLSATGPTRVESSFQNGGLRATNRIVWKPTNLMTNENLVVRQGDALLFTAVPSGDTSGSVGITVVGVANYTTDCATAIPHSFAAAGTYTVTGTYTSEEGVLTSRSITVKVVSASFGGNPAAWVGQTRVLECPGLPVEAVVEHDPAVEWRSVSPINNWGNRFFLKINSTDPHYLVARLGTAGPIMASVPIEGFTIYSSSETYVKIVQLYQDGSQLVEMMVVESPLVPSVLPQLEIFVPGVTFDDGTIRKTLHASDFDALDQSRVRFIRPKNVTSSVCHYLRATQIGSPYWLGHR